MTLDKYISIVDNLLSDYHGVINEILTDPQIQPSLMVKPRNRMRQSGPFPSVGEYKNQSSRGIKRRGSTTLRKKGNIKLYDTGDFNKNLFIELLGNKLQMDSEDKKRNLLVEKYGENIFNLKNEEINFIIVNFINPEIEKILNPGESLTIDLG